MRDDILRIISSLGFVPIHTDDQREKLAEIDAKLRALAAQCGEPVAWAVCVDGQPVLLQLGKKAGDLLRLAAPAAEVRPLVYAAAPSQPVALDPAALLDAYTRICIAEHDENTDVVARVDAMRRAIEVAGGKASQPVALPDGCGTGPMDAIDADNGFRSYPWTFTNQPGNLGASVLGGCAKRARPGGDSIDHGLSLLRELHAQGLGIVRVPRLDAAPEVPRG